MTNPEPLNLEQLGDSYEIIGEFAARDDARTFMAKRRSDGLDVLIAVARTPEGDQGNALSHLAADANLLKSLEHRVLLPIVEGRWVGTDEFAIVMQRTKAPTLHELLSRRDEDFGFPRIAAVLREANGVLEWARERKVVHRAITPETLFVEPGSDRVCAAFAISPLPTSGVPGADADARTIASLARAMFTRSPAAPERAERPLAELRPGLPASLVEETEALLQPVRAVGAPGAPGAPSAPTNVTAYIARIAMAESLKEAEVHLEETRNAIEEQKRVHREQIDKERREHEQQLAAERKEHEGQVAEQAKSFGKERESFERELAKERKALEKERDALAKERASHSKAAAALALEREAHAKDRATLLEERARHEQLRKEERERLAAEVAALQAQAKLHAQTAQAQTAEREQVIVESRRAKAESKQAGSDFKKFVVAPVPGTARPKPTSTTPPGTGTAGTPTAATPASGPAWRNQMQALRPRWDKKWNVPAAAAAMALLIAVTVRATRGGRDEPQAQLRVAQGPAARVIDSVGGTVAIYESIVPLPEVTTDTTALAAAASDWTPPPKRRPKPLEQPKVEAQSAEPKFIFQDESTARRDSANSAAPAPRVDTVFRRDSVVRRLQPTPRRDSVPRADTLVKRDSLRRR